MRSILILLIITTNQIKIDSQINLSNGLLAYYKFNKDLSKDTFVVTDETGQNHGTIYGKILYDFDRFNNPCAALNFDGNTYIVVPNSKSLKKPSKEITITVWFKIHKGADLFNQWITICCKSNITDENESSPQYRMQATAQTISINSSFTKKVIPQLDYDKWYFYAYTYDGKNVKAYLNGRFFLEENYTAPLKVNNMPLIIGRDMPGKMENFNGIMDDLRIYDRALSNLELYELYTSVVDAVPINFCITKPNNAGLNTLPNIDTIDKLPTHLDFIPIDFQGTVQVQSDEITIYAFDNNIDDGDVISINVNGIWVKENYIIRTKSNNPPVGDLINVKIYKGTNNYIISKAINEGKIPLNTLTYMIDDGFSKQYVKINSKIGLSAGIKIIYK
jgi:hypothetical protein